MTANEAVERIKDHIGRHFAEEPRTIYISRALYVAVKALEKQIPNKIINEPTYTYGDVPYTALCPNCRANLGYEAQHTYKHCFNCGQTLDWGKEDEGK